MALYFPKDRDKVGDIIKENFTLLEEPKIFPKKKETPNYVWINKDVIIEYSCVITPKVW